MSGIISRADARAQGLKRYFTGKPCSKGHVAERLVSSSACVVCNARRALCWARSHPTEMLERTSEWRSKNPEKLQQQRERDYAQRRTRTAAKAPHE